MPKCTECRKLGAWTLVNKPTSLFNANNQVINSANDLWIIQISLT